VKANAEPVGPERILPFTTFQSVKALPCGVLELLCSSRSYHFRLDSASECERWASNLVQLAAGVGHDVPAFKVQRARAVQ
jgi:hypothetical protein